MGASMLGLAVLLVPVAAGAQPATGAPPDEPHGLTLEAGLGVGFVRTGGQYSRLDSPLYGLSLAAGAWLSPRTALTARVVVNSYGSVSGDDSSDYRYIVAGPSVQRWLTRWAWVSGGAGLAVYQAATDGGSFRSSAGAGLDLRIGVALDPLGGGSRHRLDLAIEVTPAVYRFTLESNPPPPAEWDAFVAASIVIGYQLR